VVLYILMLYTCGLAKVFQITKLSNQHRLNNKYFNCPSGVLNLLFQKRCGLQNIKNDLMRGTCFLWKYAYHV